MPGPTPITESTIQMRWFAPVPLLVAMALLQGCGAASQGTTPAAVSTLAPDMYSYCAEMSSSSSGEQAGMVPLTQVVQNEQFAHMLPDLELIPVYPHAEPIEEDIYVKGPTDRRFVHTVSATSSFTDVVKFYKEALSTNGWRPVYEVVFDEAPGYYRQDYHWHDPEGKLPWNIRLALNISGSWVNIAYARRPDLGRNLPVYPGATDITFSCSENHLLDIYLDEGNQNYQGDIKKAFITTASREEVEDYYEQVLPEYGWFIEKDELARIIEPVSYVGGGHTRTSKVKLAGKLHISYSEAQDGKTAVSVDVEFGRLFPAIPIDARP